MIDWFNKNIVVIMIRQHSMIEQHYKINVRLDDWLSVRLDDWLSVRLDDWVTTYQVVLWLTK